MAKKKKATKPAPKRGAKVKSGKPPKRAAAKGPRSQPLPGMGQVRNRRLDTLCESIGESRDTINQATTDVNGDSQLALQVMQKDGVTHYTHAGVELILRKGADKLSVKLLKDKTAEGAPSPKGPAKGDEEPAAEAAEPAEPGHAATSDDEAGQQ